MQLDNKDQGALCCYLGRHKHWQSIGCNAPGHMGLPGAAHAFCWHATWVLRIISSTVSWQWPTWWPTQGSV